MGGVTIIDTTDAVRVLGTNHPPAWHLPVAALRGARLRPAGRTTRCACKGRATYLDVVAGDDGRVLAATAAWGHPRSAPGDEQLADRLTVCPSGWTRARLTANASGVRLEGSTEAG